MNAGLPQFDASRKKVLAGISAMASTSSLCYAAPLIQSKYPSATDPAFVIGILALGVLLGLLWYTLFLAFSTKERIFFYFLAIMLLLVILQTFATYDRFLFQLTYNRVTLVTHLLFITFLLFFEQMFGLKTHASSLSTFNRVSLWVIAAYTVLFLVLKALFPQAQELHGLLNFIRELFVFYTNILFLYTIIRSIAWMRREAVLLLVAFIPPAFITSVNALNIFAFMQSHQAFAEFLMQYNQPIGLSLQAILFSLATANRYNRIKEERHHAEQMQQHLSELNTQRTRFFLQMSHETRTPLTLILGLVRQMRQESYGVLPKQTEPILSAIERNSMILLRLVNHMLRLERTQHSRIDTPLAVQKTVSLITEMFLPIAQEGGLHLAFVSSPSCADLGLAIDQEDFESLLMNLLSNALKYTQAGGSIRITTDIGDQSQLLIAVSDTGPGIPKDQQQQIFEQFGVVRDTRVAMQTGLGLPLVKHIMQEYGAVVRLDSEMGKGSTFTLDFPVSLVRRKDKNTPEAVASLAPLYLSDFSHLASAEQQSDPSLPSLLVVEDNADLRAFIQSILQPYYRVLCAASAIQGLDFLQKEHIDLIISDIMMPEMDGHAFLREAKALLRKKPIPLIFLTARDSTEEKIDALKEGAIRYITKPFRSEILLAVIASVLQHDKELVGSRIEQFRIGFTQLLDQMEHPRLRANHITIEDYASGHGLTGREVDILRLVVEGKSDKAISSSLSVSVKTVANHNRSIYAKCQVSGRYELLAKLFTFSIS